MRIQIIPSPQLKFLKEFYGVRLWKIYHVITIWKHKSHHRCKVKKEWDEYEIEVTHTYPHNHYGQKTTIKLKDTECKILDDPEEKKNN